MATTSTSHKRELALTRIIDAPREMVFNAWTNSKQLAQWWGPHDFTNPVCEIDLRVGGKMHIVMRAPDGAEYPMPATVREIVAPEKFSFSSLALDTDGKQQLEGFTAVTLAEEQGKTRMTVQSSAEGTGPIAQQMIGGMDAGWAQSLERFEALIKKN